MDTETQAASEQKKNVILLAVDDLFDYKRLSSLFGIDLQLPNLDRIAVQDGQTPLGRTLATLIERVCIECLPLCGLLRKETIFLQRRYLRSVLSVLPNVKRANVNSLISAIAFPPRSSDPESEGQPDA